MIHLQTHLIISAFGSRNSNGLNVAILGLNLLCDVIHNIIVLLVIQQLISSNLQNRCLMLLTRP